MRLIPCARQARRALFRRSSLAFFAAVALLAQDVAPVQGGSSPPGGHGARAAKGPRAGTSAAHPPGPLGTAEPWDQPFAGDPAAILRGAAEAAASQAGQDPDPVIVLLSEYRYSFDEAGRETSAHRLVYLLATGAADESWSTVSEGWSPWHQARPEVRARVITPDGVVHPLDPAVLSETGEAQEGPDMFGDGRVLRGPLPATGTGAVVEQEVTVRDTAPFFAGGTVQALPLAAGVTVRRARVTLETPAGFPLRYTSHLLPEIKPREELVAGRRRLTFEVTDLAPADDPEPGLPPDAARYASLSFATGSSWGDVARRYSEIVDAAIRGADLSAWLREAHLAGAESQLETVNRVLSQLAAIRYTGVELGQGGIVPRTPAETLRRKFGDCKDKSVLLIAALRALDIPAYIALLNAADDEPDVEASLPGFGAFNHAIVIVPGTPPLWIDPTDRFARAGELPVEDQGRLSLVVTPATTGLTRIPEAPATENRETFTREFFLADLGEARVVETTESTGDDERRLRSFYAAEEPDSVRDALADYAKRVLRARSLSSIDHTDPLDLAHPFRLRLEVKQSGRGFTTESSAVVAVQTATLLEHLPGEILPADGDDRSGRTDAAWRNDSSGAGAAGSARGHDQRDDRDGHNERGSRGERPADREGEPRHGDYFFSRPRTLELRYRVTPPAGFVARPLPASRVRRLGPATLSEEYRAEPSGVVTATLRFETGKRRISAAEFEDLRREVGRIAAEKPTLLGFDQVGEADLGAGKVREALAEFNREARLSPQRALPHVRIARALLQGGMGEAARREAELATRLEPDFGPAFRALGWVLEHDAIGRRFGAGFERGAAIAAYRKAKSLDDQDEASRASLAILLSHDDRGELYGAGADLPAAIAEYQALRKDLRTEDWDQNLLEALLFAGRLEDVKKLAGELDDSTEHVEALLVAVAASEGPEAAVRQAERRLEDARSRTAALSWAAQNLIAMRRYPEAAALLGRAAQDSPDAAALLARAEILRRARRREAITFSSRNGQERADPAAAADLARQLLWEATAEHPATARILALWSADLREELGAPAHRALRDELLRTLAASPGRALREVQRDGLMPREALQEVGIAAYHESVTGDEAQGYRVELTAGLGERIQRQTIYLVSERGQVRIAAVGGVPALLGRQALRRLDRGDLDGARRWLDWAVDEGSPAYGDPPAPPFAALWTQGRTAATTDPGSTAERCAALTLLGREMAPAELGSLLACRDGATDEPRRLAFEAALGTAYGQLGRHAEMLDIAHHIAAARPGSLLAFAFETSALSALKRTVELETAARRRLALLPGDGPARSVLAELAIQAGDLDRAQETLAGLAAEGKASAPLLNELAWLSLFRGHADEQTIEIAQRSAGLSGFKSYNELHTLAALYAEVGKTAEAYRLIIQALETREDPAPDESTWYLFGRLAEQYGLPDQARRLYAKVKPGGPAEVLSSYRLAQARLAALPALSPSHTPAKAGAAASTGAAGTPRA